MKIISALCASMLMVSALQADLSQYIRHDPRFNVKPINKSYDQIPGYNAKIQAWNRDFKGKYGQNWDILIDLRGGGPGRISGQGIPIIPGSGNSLPYNHETTLEEIESLAISFLKRVQRPTIIVQKNCH